MNQKQQAIDICFLVVSLVISGCGPGQLLGPTLTPTSTSTLTPTVTPTNTPTATPVPTYTPIPPTATATPIPKPRLTTSVGVLEISSVQRGDRFPPGCSLDSLACQQAQAGYQVLVVWLESAEGSDPADISSDLFEASQGVYVIAADGSQTNSMGGGMIASRLFVAFTPPASATDFQLFWPGNSVVDLEE